ncbi:serine protease [Gammaproteobacteria bacterium]|nr:serine protease [Gammaproteobacteria bacterium]
MHNLIKVLVLPLFFISLISSNDIYEDNALGVVLLMGDAGFGSGVIISSKGYVLTNNHVVENNENLKAILNYQYNLDGYEEFEHSIEIIKQDKVKDLALIKINKPRTLLKPIKISRKVPPIGSRVHAIGHPDLEVWTYTTGYISQFRHEYEWSYKDDFEHMANVYQTQTPIAEGNSGGPLLNNHGNLVGINTFGDSENDFQNFSVSVDEIIKFLIN